MAVVEFPDAEWAESNAVNCGDPCSSPLVKSYLVPMRSPAPYLMALLLLACHADDSLLGRRCTIQADCGGDVLCSRFYLGGQCTARCTSNEDCSAALGEEGECLFSGFCVKACGGGGQCPSGNRCTEGGLCEADEPLSTSEREDANKFAATYCAAVSACECPPPPPLDPNVPFGDQYFEGPDCVESQVDSFLLRAESELAFSRGCFNERLVALESRDCSPEGVSFQWEKAACPIWSGERGLKEACYGGWLGASDCAPGLYCISRTEGAGRCSDVYALPGQGEACVAEPPECAPNFYCEGNIVGVDGWVCNQNPPLNSPCAGPWDCGGLACVDGSCVELSGPGTPCEEMNFSCDYGRGSYCRDGACSEPVPLECDGLDRF